MTDKEALKVIGSMKPGDRLDTLKKAQALSVAMDALQERIERKEAEKNVR